MIQSFKTTMDPVTGDTASPLTSPIPIYPGVLPYVTFPTPPPAGPNPSITTGLPSNYSTKLPVATLPACGDSAAAAVLLGLPAAAGQSVRAGIGCESDGRGRLGAISVR